MQARVCLLALSFAGVLPAQDVITEDAVREIVTWLAADERRGRDTGSAELDEAAQWLAKRFAAAGLKQATEGTWFHEYGLPGLSFDAVAIEVQLTRKHGEDTQQFKLVPGDDVRLWRASDATGGKDETCTVAFHGDPALQRQLNASSARRPTVVEVGTDHAFWRQSEGERRVLGGRRAASRPVFLVRQGLLPPPPADTDSEVSWTVTWSAKAAEKAEISQRNVVGLLPGTTKKDEYIVVSAHYDHVGEGEPRDGDSIYNGADDNATGTTAVVLLAEVLAKGPAPARSILFVCFSAEERGLKGSAAFCEKPPVPLDRIVANLNFEMLGRPEPGQQGKAWITGADFSDFAAIAKPALERGGVELIPFRMADQLFAASDNWPFVQRSIVAHSLSAGSLHADYHQPGDEVEKLDITHMTKIVKSLVEVVREFADRDAAPAWNEKGKKMLSRQKR